MPPLDDDDSVEVLSLRLVHVHQRYRVRFGGPARDELVSEDAADDVCGPREGSLAVPDVAESPGQHIGSLEQAEQPGPAEHFIHS